MYIFKILVNTFFKEINLQKRLKKMVRFLNKFLNKKFKKYFILLLLLFLFTSISAMSYVHAVSTHLADSVFRLHIIANSDSYEDQNLKYKVRDAEIAYLSSISKGINSKEEVIALVKENLNNFQKIAENVVKENGYSYKVTVHVNEFYFPTKNYGDISLPAGMYDALRIELGSATGQNWWCVMFPPLCFVDVSSGIVPDESKEVLQSNLSEEEFAIISQENEEVKFKFKLLEFFNDISNILTAKK